MSLALPVQLQLLKSQSLTLSYIRKFLSFNSNEIWVKKDNLNFDVKWEALIEQRCREYQIVQDGGCCCFEIKSGH